MLHAVLVACVLNMRVCILCAGDVDILLTHPDEELAQGLLEQLLRRLRQARLVTDVLAVSKPTGGAGGKKQVSQDGDSTWCSTCRSCRWHTRFVYLLTSDGCGSVFIGFVYFF